jgi:hypothetical protein
MNRVEFSDINRFLTSIGLIFLLSSAVLPWFINQNSSVITIDQNTIDSSTDAGKRIIVNQQEYLLFISDHLVCISGTLLVLGILLLGIGIYRWKKRQRVIDEIQNEELKSKQKENISPEQKMEIITHELEKEDQNPAGGVETYLNIENSIYLKLSQFYKVNYDTTRDIRIGQFTYDIIVKSKFIEQREDIILEVKYYYRNPGYTRTLDALNRLLLAVNHYESTQRRNATPILIFVLNPEIDKTKFLEHKFKLAEYLANTRPDCRLKIFGEDELRTIDAPSIISGE